MSNNASVFLHDQIIEFLIFQVGEVRCGLNILELEGISWVPTITPVHSAPDYVKGLLNLRGQVVTVCDLGKRLGFEECQIGKKSRVIIIRTDMEYIGLLVDSVIEVIAVQAGEVDFPPANTMESKAAFFNGIVKRGNKLTTILNLEEVIKAEE